MISFRVYICGGKFFIVIFGVRFLRRLFSLQCVLSLLLAAVPGPPYGWRSYETQRRFESQRRMSSALTDEQI